MVNDCLQRFSWSMDDPVLTTIATIDSDSGAIRGMRYATRGPGPKLRFSAAELWTTSEEISIEINLSDLSVLPWLAEGNVRNQTSWLDS